MEFGKVDKTKKPLPNKAKFDMLQKVSWVARTGADPAYLEITSAAADDDDE